MTEGINLPAAGVEFNPKNGRSRAWTSSRTSRTCMPSASWFAAGTHPVAIKTGLRLANRLYGTSTEKMDYNLVPTTVSASRVRVHRHVRRARGGDVRGGECRGVPELLQAARMDGEPRGTRGVAVREDNVLLKLITNLADDERVVGFHYVGPNAGEVTQGYAVAMKMGARERPAHCRHPPHRLGGVHAAEHHEALGRGRHQGGCS